MSSQLDLHLLPQRQLSDGTPVPPLGLGTFGSDKYGPEAIAAAVDGAVRYGYRLIDCASVEFMSFIEDAYRCLKSR